MKNFDLLFLDLEVPNDCNSSVCQISVIGEKININETINPKVNFGIFHKKFHGITESHVSSKKDFKQLFLDKINIYDPNYIWIGHNVSFDLNVIAKDALRFEQKISEIKCICTMKMFKKLYSEEFPNIKHDLKSVSDFFKINLQKHHNAYYDALACKEIFENIIKDKNIDFNQYLEIMHFDILEKGDIKYFIINELDILRSAIACDVYSNLLNCDFDDKKLYLKFEERKNEFYYLLGLKTNKKIDISYSTYIEKNKFSINTKKTIYFQIMLSYFASDTKISKSESIYIINWLEKLDKKLIKNFPFSIFYKKIKDSLEDGVITNQESNEIILIINNLFYKDFFKKNCLNEKKDLNNNTINIFDKIENYIDFIEGKIFCLTGNFKIFLSKESFSSILKTKFKMLEKKDISKSVDFLIIGSLGSDAWAYGSYGGKIKKALELKEKNNDLKLKIISEEEIINKLDLI